MQYNHGQAAQNVWGGILKLLSQGLRHGACNNRRELGIEDGQWMQVEVGGVCPLTRSLPLRWHPAVNASLSTTFCDICSRAALAMQCAAFDILLQQLWLQQPLLLLLLHAPAKP